MPTTVWAGSRQRTPPLSDYYYSYTGRGGLAQKQVTSKEGEVKSSATGLMSPRLLSGRGRTFVSDGRTNFGGMGYNQHMI